MRVSEEWEDRMCEEYCVYLDELDTDISPMGYEAFEHMKLKGAEEEYAELYEECL
jgi:hypothetical protein